MIEKSMRAMAGALVLTGTIASTVHAQTTTLYPRWSHQSGSENWVAREVSLGNEGTEVFSQLDVSGLSRRLFTEGCSAVAAPVWQSTDGQSTFYQRVASCKSISLHASARDEVVSGAHVVRLRAFKSSSSQPIFTYTTPPATSAYSAFDALMTPNGERIAFVYYSPTTGMTEIRLFAAPNYAQVAAFTIDSYGPAMHSSISRDGARMYVASALAGNIVDLATGQVEFRNIVYAQASNGQSMSGSGQVYVYCTTWNASVYKRALNGTWSLAFTRPLPAGRTYDQARISDDGSRLVLGSSTTPASSAVFVELINLTNSLATSAPQVLWSNSLTSTSSLPNLVSDIQTSDDGATIAVGVWGDEAGGGPELFVYRNDDATPRYVMDLNGSVQRLALAFDGKHLVTASKARHNTVFSGDGSIDYFDLGTPDLTVQDVPHAGGTVTLRAKTDAGRPVRLLSASGRSTQPTPLGTVGMLHLSRTQLVSLSPTAVSDAQGVAQFTWPLSSATVGTSIYFQSLQLQPRELGQDWCKVTVLP